MLLWRIINLAHLIECSAGAHPNAKEVTAVCDGWRRGVSRSKAAWDEARSNAEGADATRRYVLHSKERRRVALTTRSCDLLHQRQLNLTVEASLWSFVCFRCSAYTENRTHAQTVLGVGVADGLCAIATVARPREP